MDTVKISKLSALKDHIVVTDMNFGSRVLSSGIQVLSDDGRSAGIRPRWAQVYAVGPDQKDITAGQWLLIAHGRWTRGAKIEDPSGVHVLRRVDPNDVLLVSDDQPSDDTFSDATLIDNKDRW
jgi:hypothetical protein